MGSHDDHGFDCAIVDPVCANGWGNTSPTTMRGKRKVQKEGVLHMIIGLGDLFPAPARTPQPCTPLLT